MQITLCRVVRDDTLASGKFAGVVGVGDQKFRGALWRRRARWSARWCCRRVMLSPFLSRPAASRSSPSELPQEDEAAFGTRQAQCRFQQCIQHIVEYAAGIQLARCLKENVQHLQVGTRAGGRLPGGELAQELLRCAGRRAVRAEQHVRSALDAELNVIVAAQFAAVDAFAVDEGPVAAALVNDVDAVHLIHELRVFARDPRVGHHQVAVGAAANGEAESDRARGCGGRHLPPPPAHADRWWRRCRPCATTCQWRPSGVFSLAVRGGSADRSCG